MFERFTQQARMVVVRAQDEARTLGHRFIGTEHLLLGMLGEENGIAAGVLRDAGVRAEAVRAEIRRLVDGDDEPLGEQDTEALRAIGIDLDAVRAQVERTFGPGALDARPEPGPKRRWLGRRNQQGPRTGHIPFSKRAKKVLELSLREATQLRHGYIGSEHILLGLLREGEGLAAKILHDAGLSLPELRRRTIDQLGSAA
jgi:ATP-dependent Clp protease ATP-binding subunit ClpA